MMSPATVHNVKLTLAYDGTRYCGWQVQPNGPTIQAELERAITRVTGEKCAVLSAGRTDSGVHALGQVASFHTTSPIPAANWPAALRSCLPADIVVRSAEEVPLTFHATFSAKRKRYRYVIDNERGGLPFWRQYAYQVWAPLDAAAMHQAAQELVGTHDFRSFETEWPNKATSVRTVLEITIQRCAGWGMWSALSLHEMHHPPRVPISIAEPANEPQTGSDPVSSAVLSEESSAVSVATSTATAAVSAAAASFESESESESGTGSDSESVAGVRPASARVEGSGPFIVMDISADGFLYNMVRSIMGTLINVGRGKWGAADIARILRAQDRSVAGNTAPACGLYLVEVTY